METIDIITVGIAFFSLIFSVYSMWYSTISRKQFGRNETIQNIQPILIDRYAERKLSTKYEDIYNLKELRYKICLQYDMQKDNAAAVLNELHSRSRIVDTIENKFAYEAAGALQEIGLMLLTGSIPVEVVVSSNGYQFIQDWLFSYSLTEKIREDATLEKILDDGGRLKYHRIHGEWLASFSYLYFKKHWSGNLLNVYKEYFETIELFPEKLERTIRETETQIIPSYTANRIKQLI